MLKPRGPFEGLLRFWPRIYSNQMNLPLALQRFSLWWGLWVCAVVLSWLVPNHYPPWSGFHSDALSALALVLASAYTLWRSDSPWPWHGSAVLVAALVGVPWLQYSAGQLAYAGQAWITSLYVLGLLLALLTGLRWEKLAPGQLMDGLFLAIGMAALLSVHLQLQTWLDVIDTGIFDLWSMGLSSARPYANLGQPNQLATLLLWGVLACAWGFLRGQVRAWVAVLMVSLLLLGVALTQSRTAWLGLTCLLLATWVWRQRWPSKRLPWIATALFAFFWVCPFLLRALSDALLLGVDSSYLRSGQLQSDLRVQVWRLFLEAAWQQPWWGYGWTEVAPAQMAVASKFPSLQGVFGHAHNLFLDLILWLGIPLGGLVSLALLAGLLAAVRAMKNAQDAILILFLVVIGIHAMLELPLHYAYFLLPTGMVVGVLNHRLGGLAVWAVPRWAMVLIWLGATVLLTVVVRDYLRVEASFQTLRFELAHIGNLPPDKPPEIVALTQLRERILWKRFKAKPDMRTQELDDLRRVALVYPDMSLLYNVATAMALNQHFEEAGTWLTRLCKISSREECDHAKLVWAQDARANPLLAAIRWPQ